MERLTKKVDELGNQYIPTALCSIGRNEEVDDYEGCKDYCEGREDCHNCAIQQCFDQLGEYEDTGLTPKQITEIDEEYTQQAKELMELRKEKQTGGWIPTKDRLPERTTNALVQISGKYGGILFEDAFELAVYVHPDGWTLENFPDWTNPHVIAWQALPVRYKPQKGEAQ